MVIDMKVIDGSQGEGGGQVLRSSLSLAMCTRTPVRIENIRAGRKKPGLLRQHLTCVLASQQICQARVEGAELGSAALTFTPGDIQAGDYSFAIGSAGSTTLVFQTILPALLLAGQHSTVCLRGGTHNQRAPSFDFIQHSFFRALQQMNINVSVELMTYGFQPVGGGEWRATIQPLSTIKPLQLNQQTIVSRSAVVTQSGIERSIAERELKRVSKKLQFAAEELHINQVQAPGAGNLLSLRLRGSEITEVIESIGQTGISAERVAGRAIQETKRYLKSGAVVGEHLCDQLLLPMALGNGGRFTTLKPTLHTLTNKAVIESLIDCEIKFSELDEDCFEVRVEK